MHITMPYGTTQLELRVDSGDAEEIMYRADRPAWTDEQLADRLAAPDAGPALREQAKGKGSAAIVISDQTRLVPSDRILPPLLDEMNAGGIPDERIAVIVALGAHRHLTPEERRRLVGSHVWERVQVYNHSVLDEDNVPLGVTKLGTPVAVNRRLVEAELRVVTGNIEPHRLVGVSGGVKAVVPGCAARRTIEANHSLSHRYKAELGNPRNPIHDDLAEAAGMLEVHFMYNVIVDHRREVMAAFCGSLTEAHAKGVEFVRHTFFVRPGKPYDLIVASCGGQPKDLQLYQAIKSMQNAASFLKTAGGTLLCLAQCPEHFGNGSFQEWIESGRDLASMATELKQRFVLGPHKIEHIENLLKTHRIALYSEIPRALVELTGFEPVEDPQAWLNQWTIANPDAAIGIMPAASVTYPLPSA